MNTCCMAVLPITDPTTAPTIVLVVEELFSTNRLKQEYGNNKILGSSKPSAVSVVPLVIIEVEAVDTEEVDEEEDEVDEEVEDEVDVVRSPVVGFGMTIEISHEALNSN